MAWERRARGGSYYTRSVRSGGRIRREYLGTGPLAEAAAREVAERVQERQERQALRQQLADQARAVEAHGAALSVLAEAALIVAGARRHKGQWRPGRRMEDGS